MDSLSTHISAAARTGIRAYLTIKARMLGKRFFCVALAGGSGMNICINSDMTLSCTCHDVDGTGHIGDLDHQSLEEAFSTGTAQRFREELAAGRLPTSLCARCCDLRMMDREKADAAAQRFQMPKYMMVENTSACNLRCVSCPRMKIGRTRRRVSMSPADVLRVAEQLRASRVRHIAYLNQGEPFLSKAIREQLETIRRVNPQIRIDTSTNGMLIDTDEKREAALLIDKMQVSLDGMSQEVASKYQRGIDFDRAYRNMRNLVRYRDARGLDRPVVVWKYLLFRWNERRQQVEQAIEMAKEAGVDEILFEKTVSPIHGVPWRSYLGMHDSIGEPVWRGRCLSLRPHEEPITPREPVSSASGEAEATEQFPDLVNPSLSVPVDAITTVGFMDSSLASSMPDTPAAGG